MAERSVTTSTKETTSKNAADKAGTALRRRGVLAAAWAAVAAVVLRQTTQPVEAAAGLQFQDVAGGGYVQNGAGGPTSIFAQAGYTGAEPLYTGITFQGATTCGLAGLNSVSLSNAPMPCGVWGWQAKSAAGSSAGVVGENENATGIGVLGKGGHSTLTDGVGVQGESAGGIGVLGRIGPFSNRYATAVYGLNYSTYAGPGPGAGGFGVYGLSAKGHGLVGATAAAGGAAVVGATNGVAGAYAAAFYGSVVVGGDLTVVGGAKSAAVSHPDGSLRRLYCVESPESWFEDFGKEQLTCGQAKVTIDPDFAAIVNLDDYHVFVTGYDDFELRVADQTATGFLVLAKNPSSSGRFSWRVVAKRKDIRGERLEPVTVPPEPILPPLPQGAI
jgi:hypothetical protein